jgi:serine/threonine protein kinase
MQTEVVQAGAKSRGDLRKPHISPSNSDMPRRAYSPEAAMDGGNAAYVRHEPPAGSARSASQPSQTQQQQQQPQQQPHRPPPSGTTATPPVAPADNAAATTANSSSSDRQIEVEGTGCTYVLREEIGRGAYGKVYLTDVVHTDLMQSSLPVPPSLPPPTSSAQLPSLRRSAGVAAERGSANTTTKNNNVGSSSSASNGHRNSCSYSSTNNATGRMVLKRMENASVEDGLQAATLREFMVLDEVSMGSFDRERSEVEAFRAGRVVFRATPCNTIIRLHDYGGCAFLDNSNNNNTVDTDGRWDDEVLAASTSRNGDYDYFSSSLRRRINLGRNYLIGMRDTIMLPHEQLAYVAMDYCEGGDLWHFIRDLKLTLRTSGLRFGDVMPVKVFRRWAVELISALAFLHSRNISHRDLKPQNLMLAKRSDIPLVPAPPPPPASASASSGSVAPLPTPDAPPQSGDNEVGRSEMPAGEQYNLKVGDFGLSRLEDIPYKKYVHEAVTLWYRSPDVLLGNTNYTFSADAWSLGCILVEMASGSVLFKGRDEADELRHIFTRGCRPSLLNFPLMKEYPFTERFTEVLQKYRDTESEAKAATDGINADAALQTHVEKLARHLRAFLKERNAHNLLGMSGIDLVARLLVFNPERRFTVLQAVRHSFFVDAYEEIYGSD